MRTPTLEELYLLGFHIVPVKDKITLCALCYSTETEALLVFPAEMKYEELRSLVKRILIKWRIESPIWEEACKELGELTEEEKLLESGLAKIGKVLEGIR